MEGPRYWVGFAAGVVGIVILVGLLLGVVGLMVPFGVLSLLIVLIWKTCWGPVYAVYLRHLGWVHIGILRYMGHRVPLMWGECRSARGTRVFGIQNLTDNYAWLIVTCPREGHEGPLEAALVDVGDAQCVADAVVDISQRVFDGTPIDVLAILTTHHHWDHMMGNIDFPAKYYTKAGQRPPTDIHVYASTQDSVVGTTHPVRDCDVVKLNNVLVFNVMHSPCHTHGHVMYHLDGAQPCLFSGDTLFIGGAGGVFEGEDLDMTRSHATALERCDLSTIVYSGHEYSSSLLSKQVFTDRATNNPALYFRLAADYYTAQHNVTCGHPSVPLATLGSMLVSNVEFRRIYDYGLILAQAMYHSLTDDEAAALEMTRPRVVPLPTGKEQPFTTLYTAELELLEKQLLEGTVSGKDAGLLLKKMRREWSEVGNRPGHVAAHDALQGEAVARALVILGSKPGTPVSKPLFGKTPDPLISFERLEAVLARMQLDIKPVIGPLLDLIWEKATNKAEGAATATLTFSSALTENRATTQLSLSVLASVILPLKEEINIGSGRHPVPTFEHDLSVAELCRICPCPREGRSFTDAQM